MREERLEFKGHDGLLLVATACGEKGAPAVLLLHGGGQTWQSWGGTAKRLAASGRYRWHWDPRFMSETGPAEMVDSDRLLRAAGALEVPTLLVRGRESDVISLDGVREFQAVAPHAEFVDVSGAGHMVAGDRNDAFTEAVQGFLERHDPV